MSDFHFPQKYRSLDSEHSFFLLKNNYVVSWNYIDMLCTSMFQNVRTDQGHYQNRVRPTMIKPTIYIKLHYKTQPTADLLHILFIDSQQIKQKNTSKMLQLLTIKQFTVNSDNILHVKVNGVISYRGGNCYLTGLDIGRFGPN